MSSTVPYFICTRCGVPRRNADHSEDTPETCMLCQTGTTGQDLLNEIKFCIVGEHPTFRVDFYNANGDEMHEHCLRHCPPAASPTQMSHRKPTSNKLCNTDGRTNTQSAQTPPGIRPGAGADSAEGSKPGSARSSGEECPSIAQRKKSLATPTAIPSTAEASRTNRRTFMIHVLRYAHQSEYDGYACFGDLSRICDANSFDAAYAEGNNPVMIKIEEMAHPSQATTFNLHAPTIIGAQFWLENDFVVQTAQAGAKVIGVLMDKGVKLEGCLLRVLVPKVTDYDSAKQWSLHMEPIDRLDSAVTPVTRAQLPNNTWVETADPCSHYFSFQDHEQEGESLQCSQREDANDNEPHARKRRRVDRHTSIAGAPMPTDPTD